MEKLTFGCRGDQERIGILVAQLGTPDAPTPKALYRYLKQFLWDPRVIEANRIVWWFVLNFIVLITRPKRSARLYRRIWTEKGSPLLEITKSQTQKLRDGLKILGVPYQVEFGMRYGNPSLESAIDSLIKGGCSRILLFPMYPQYSATTTASTYDAVFMHLLKRRVVPTLRVAEPYYRHPAYIRAFAEVINESLRKMRVKPQCLVLSYHGIPEAYVKKGDTYCCMCTETTRALRPMLSIAEKDVIHTYQSRFGKDPWLVPYTDETIMALPEKGYKNIAVVAPGFTTDCLETLDELGNEGKHQFESKGGEEFSLIPCLNDSEFWIDAMVEIISEEVDSWVKSIKRVKEGKSVSCPVKEVQAA